MLGILALLGQMAQLGRGRSIIDGGGGAAYASGQLIGALVVIVIPIVIGSLLIAKSRRRSE